MRQASSGTAVSRPGHSRSGRRAAGLDGRGKAVRRPASTGARRRLRLPEMPAWRYGTS